MTLEQAIRTNGKLPLEITPIAVMRFMSWSCRDYNEAPAKLVETIRLYMNALGAARNTPTLSMPQGPPEAFKRIMRGW